MTTPGAEVAVPPTTGRASSDSPLLTGLPRPNHRTQGVRIAQSAFDDLSIAELPQLRERWFNKSAEFKTGPDVTTQVHRAKDVAPTATAPSTERATLLTNLVSRGFTLMPRVGDVDRYRLANATSLGYPGALNVLVPQSFSRAAPAHVYLHGHMLEGGGNLEAQVLGRHDQHSFQAMLDGSGSRGMAIIPESPGQNTVFNAQWGGIPGDYAQLLARGQEIPGARRFDTLMDNVAGLRFAANDPTPAAQRRFTAASLSTHSGSGLVGDQLVLASRFGREAVRFRGHFDDGFGTQDWMWRFNADRALDQRGATVLSLARTPQHSDHIGEGSNHMNAAAFFERTGRPPVFVTTPYRGGSDTFIREGERLPTRPMSDFLGDQLPGRITRFNVTSRNHWEPINAWTTLLRASNQKP